MALITRSGVIWQLRTFSKQISFSAAFLANKQAWRNTLNSTLKKIRRKLIVLVLVICQEIRESPL